MQGRTPLHLAAEKGRVECAEYLREQMRAERVNRDPVGVHAPVDLAGTTPLGWAAYGSKGLVF
jgi:ankyrin repeat protein